MVKISKEERRKKINMQEGKLRGINRSREGKKERGKSGSRRKDANIRKVRKEGARKKEKKLRKT